MDTQHRNHHPALMPISDEELARESWKVFQIMGEFVDGFERLAHLRPSVSIFGSARILADDPLYALTEVIAHKLSDAGFAVVTRKVMFVKYATAYVVMPGGFGTLDELAEIITLVQTGKSRKIPIVLVHTPFWTGLLEWFRNTLVKQGTIAADDLDLFVILDDADAIVKHIFHYYKRAVSGPSAAERANFMEI